MSTKTDIGSKMEEVLNSLGGIRRATPRPFLYTRIMARISKDATTTRWEKMASYISKPSYAFATIVLFLLINVAVIFHFSANTKPVARDNTTVVSDNEYSLSVSSLYDINPDQNDLASK